MALQTGALRTGALRTGLCATLLALAACSNESSNPAPPRLVAPLTLSDRSSTIAMPVSIKLSDLQTLVNAEVPVLLHSIDQPQKVCIKTKSKLLPDISCRLVGEVTRGPITLTGKGQSIVLTMPVNATLSAENIGKIIKKETATGGLVVTATVKLGLGKDWQPAADLTTDYVWTDKVGIDILGQRITFADKVDPKLKALIAKLEAKLPAQIAKLNARAKIARVWAKGFTSIRAQTDPPIWVRFAPQQVGYSGYQVRGDELVFGLAARAITQTVLGERPPDPAPTPLPQLMHGLPPEGINVHVPVLVRYAFLETALAKALPPGRVEKLEVPAIGSVEATFGRVTVYGSEGGALAIGVDVLVKTLGSLVTTKGKVWLRAVPLVDAERKIVSVKALEVYGDTDSKAFNLLLGVVSLPSVNERLVAGMRYDFSKAYAIGLAKADRWLAAEPLEGFVFRGKMGTAVIRKVQVAAEGLLIEADATGTGELIWDPDEAARLVAARKARRIERERRKAEKAVAAAAAAAAAAARPVPVPAPAS